MILKFFFLLTLILIVVTGSAYSSGKELIFNTQDFKPYTYEADGIVSGPAADIIRAVCDELNIPYKFRLLPWIRAQHEVKKGQANALFVVGRNKIRENWLHFTPPVFDVEYGFFVSTDNPLQYKSEHDVLGYSVGVYGPSNTAYSLETIKQKIKDLTIDMTPNDISAFQKLSVGRVDAVFSNKKRGLYLIQTLGLKNIRYAGCHKPLQYFFAFSKQFNDPKLVNSFNATLKKLYKSGRLHAILKKYNFKPAAVIR